MPTTAAATAPKAWTKPLFDMSIQSAETSELKIGPFNKNEFTNSSSTVTGFRYSQKDFHPTNATTLKEALVAAQFFADSGFQEDGYGRPDRLGEFASAVMQSRDGRFWITDANRSLTSVPQQDRHWWANDRMENVITAKSRQPALKAIALTKLEPFVFTKDEETVSRTLIKD